MSDIKIYTEIGYGNDTFVNAETELPNGIEIRKAGFKKMIIEVFYIRLWLGGYNVYIASAINGFNKQ